MRPNGENWDRTDYYYTISWQVVEERVAADQASEDTVATTVRLWGQDRNQRQRGVQWQFSTADARIKLRRLYPQVQLA